jgi:phosphate-selective porin OprO/OprP
LLAGAGAVGLWGSGVTSAGAQQSAQELQAIQAQIEQMQATIKALQKQVQDAQAQAGAAQAAAESGGKSDLDLKVKWKGAPEFSSADGKFKM